ncbi:MAG TPA: glycosyltransferase family 39 protein [Dehalococcoidia bacterium]
MSVESPAVTRVEAEAQERAAPAVRRIALARADIILCVIMFAMAIIPRAAWVAYNDRAPQGLNDPTLYVIYGDLIADGKGYTNFTGEAVGYYPVGYPAMLGALKKGGDIFGWGRSTFSIKMMNGVFGALTVVMIYLLASRLFDRRVGFAAGALLSVFPSQVFYTGTVLSEAQFTMLMVLALLILLWNPWRREGMPYGQLFAAGVVLSAATMTRGITMMLPLVLLAVWLFYLASKKRALLQTLVLFAGIAVLIVPWSIRNTLVFDTLSGPSTNLGDDLCIGNFQGATGSFVLTGKCFEGFENVTGQQLEIERSKHGTKTAIKDVLNHPVRMPKLIAYKAYWLVFHDEDGLWAAESYGNDWFISHPRREILAFAANATYYATALLMIVGAAAFVLSKDLRRLFLFLTLLYILAIPLVFFGDPRFHFPAVPLAVVVAAATVIAFWDNRRAAQPREATT